MREELLAHLTAIYEEEKARLHDSAAAISEAKKRFGNPQELSRELERGACQNPNIGLIGLGII